MHIFHISVGPPVCRCASFIHPSTHAYASIKTGAIVKVHTEFTSDDDNKHPLAMNTQGVVREIDADGDALIEFQGFGEDLWVAAANFNRLQVLAEATPPPFHFHSISPTSLV